jgi:hypothetical protein
MAPKPAELSKSPTTACGNRREIGLIVAIQAKSFPVE